MGSQKSGKVFALLCVFMMMLSVCLGVPTLAGAATGSSSLPKDSGGCTPFASGRPSCAIGTKNYKTLSDALGSVQGKSKVKTTIKLLGTITYAQQCTIENKKITFNLDGHDLIFKHKVDVPLELKNSDVDYTGAGTFQVIGIDNVALYISGGSCKLTYAETDKSSGGALYCLNGTTVVLNGNVQAVQTGVMVDSGASLTVNGTITVTGKHGCGVSAPGASTVTINGTISATGEGVSAVSGARVTVNGTITAGEYGADAFGKDSVIKIAGNVFSKTDAGVRANYGGQVTVDGTITAGKKYVDVGNNSLTSADFKTPTTLEGYQTYTDGTSTVWVKIAQAGADNNTPAAPASDSATQSPTATGTATTTPTSTAKPQPSQTSKKWLWAVVSAVLIIAAAAIAVFAVRASKKKR